jgi:ABC-2 type transport system ATP-binding protein
MQTQEAIAVQNLEKHYGDKAVVRDISFTVNSGEVFGLLGPNGAGKTTTIECLVGLRSPSHGSIQVLGMSPGRDRRKFAERVAIQPQSASLFQTLSVDETLALFRSFYADGADRSAIRAEVGLDEQASTRVKNLSGGQLRRLLLGVALVGNPEVVILDEPSAGLDPSARQSLWSTIRGLSARGVTVLLSTHHMDEATELCDRVGILVAGKLVALDTPEALILAREAETVVSFDVDKDADLTVLADLPGVTGHEIDVTGRGRRVRARTAAPDDLIRKLTFVKGFKARNFDIKRGTLEDLFLELSDASGENSTGE